MRTGTCVARHCFRAMRTFSGDLDQAGCRRWRSSQRSWLFCANTRNSARGRVPLFSTRLVLQWHMSAMYEVGRKDENPQKKRSEHPIGGLSREAIIFPVALACINADPNGCTNDDEGSEKSHLPLFGKTHPPIKAFSDTRAASSDIPEHSPRR